MEFITDFLSTAGIFVAALFILVLFHELGHFLTAKLFGMRVERFSIGFPPRLVGFKHGETDYCISATPLGGYVKIAGLMDETMEDDFVDEEPQPWEYRSKPVWQRMIVISAGVIFNFILAVLIYAGVNYVYGEQVVPAANVPGIYVPNDSVIEEVGFKSGDRLVAINGKQSHYFRDFFNVAEITALELEYTVERDGKEVNLKMPNDLLDRAKEEGLFSLVNAIPSAISKVQPDSPAEEAGFKEGDRIIEMNGEPVHWWMQMTKVIKSSEGTIDVKVVRNTADTVAFSVTPDPDTKTVGVQMIDPVSFFGAEEVKHDFSTSLATGYTRSLQTIIGSFQGIGKILTGQLAVKDNLGGPVAIATVTKEMTDQGGTRGFWEITAFLSLTLAVMNILPIPVLDGGHLMFLIYEGITRHKPSEKVKMVFQQVGFFLILILLIYVTFNDIVRAIGF